MSNEMVTRVGYDPLARVLNRLGDMLTAAGLYPEMPHEEAVGVLIAERVALRSRIAKLEAERGDAVDALKHAQRKAYCSYCGYVTPEDEDQEKVRTAIVEHVVSCDMNLFRVEADRLRLALERIASPPDGFEPCCRHAQEIAREALVEKP